VLHAVERLLTPLDYRGPVNVDYKIRPDGRVVILEVNCRLGGSLMRKENEQHLAKMLALLVRNAVPVLEEQAGYHDLRAA
jgi:carbamoylphosphate synthase large subunit